MPAPLIVTPFTFLSGKRFDHETTDRERRTTVTYKAVTANRLLVTLTVYFALLFGATLTVALTMPTVLSVMPFGGADALEVTGIQHEESASTDLLTATKEDVTEQAETVSQIGFLALFLASSLGGTILVMLPITWTYAAINSETGYQRSFLRVLLVLPICATTIVLLIQGKLALAFGLAAMVAAVRFRVALQEAMDGIFIFASICVGLAAGIGYLGTATVMAVFFCFTNAILWKMEFGRNPIDDALVAKKHSKLKNQPSFGDEKQPLPRN
jgi:hypothetical protein